VNHEPNLGWLSAPGLSKFAVLRTWWFPDENLLTACMALHKSIAIMEPNIYVYLSSASGTLVFVFVRLYYNLVHFGQQAIPIQSALLALLRLTIFSTKFHVCIYRLRRRRSPTK